MRQVVTAFTILISFSLFTCRNDTNAPAVSDLQLSTEDVAVTDVSLRVHISPQVQRQNQILSLRGNNSLIAAIPHPPLDTLFFIDSLLPKVKYHFQATLDSANRRTETSEPLVVTTMDTTSHDFSWEIDSLGDGASSALYDVTIVNDTLAFAVGEIHLRDSTGAWDTEPYTVAVWNGSSWRFKKLHFSLPGGGAQVILPEIRGIYFASPTEVWFAAGSIFRWDGVSDSVVISFSRLDIPDPNAELSHIWGLSSSQVWAVGNDGIIVTNKGGTWRQVVSGTGVDLFDLGGSTGSPSIWSCGFYYSRPGSGIHLLRDPGTGWEIAFDGTPHEFVVKDDSLCGSYSSLFEPDGNRLFVVSDAGLFRCLQQNAGAGKRIPLPASWTGFPWKIRGNGANDITLVGTSCMIGHYNGSTIRHYTQLIRDGNLVSVAQKNDLVIAAGYTLDPINSQGIVFIGRR